MTNPDNIFTAVGDCISHDAEVIYVPGMHMFDIIMRTTLSKNSVTRWIKVKPNVINIISHDSRYNRWHLYYIGTPEELMGDLNRLIDVIENCYVDYSFVISIPGQQEPVEWIWKAYQYMRVSNTKFTFKDIRFKTLDIVSDICNILATMPSDFIFKSCEIDTFSVSAQWITYNRDRLTFSKTPVHKCRLAFVGYKNTEIRECSGVPKCNAKILEP